MDAKQVLKKALDHYFQITGLRSYIVYDNSQIQSASEKNYFCKCLKVSNLALKKCEECTRETYESAKSIAHECIYSCHAGLIKWAVPVNQGEFHCVIVSEGILGLEQRENADYWAGLLADQYDLDKARILKNFMIIKTMNEDQMNASIELLKDLIAYHFAVL